MGIAYNTSIVRDGLVLHLDAANVKSYPGSGTTWNDLSGNGNNGTLVNGVGYTTDTNGSLVFDGVDDNVPFGNILEMGTNSFSLNAWVKSTSTSAGNGNGIIYKRGTGSSVSPGYRLNMPNGGFNLFIADGTTYNSLSSTLTSYNDGRWHNVVGVVNRQTSKMLLYVDNALSNQMNITFSTSIDSGSIIQLAVGALRLTSSSAVYHPFAGNISNVQIYNRALSDQEIQQNFNALRGRYGI